MLPGKTDGLLAVIAALGFAAAAPAEESDAPFELISLPAPGRTAFAEIADLDGDGRGDLVSASFTKLPPNQLRKLRVHFQREDGGFREAPDWVAPLPDGAAAYDFLETPSGVREMLFMRRDRVTVLSLAGRAPVWRDVPLPGTTLAAAPDERGIDRLLMARAGLGDAPLLVVPGFGEVFVTRLDGQLVGRLATQSRANFFVPPRPGLLVSDNEADLYFEHPRIDVGEVDGDGRGDLIVSNRHEVLVFAGRESGGFSGKGGSAPRPEAALGAGPRSRHRQRARRGARLHRGRTRRPARLRDAGRAARRAHPDPAAREPRRHLGGPESRSDLRDGRRLDGHRLPGPGRRREARFHRGAHLRPDRSTWSGSC